MHMFFIVAILYFFFFLGNGYLCPPGAGDKSFKGHIKVVLDFFDIYIKTKKINYQLD